MALALRCAADSIPPQRLAVCLDLLAQGSNTKAGQVSARLGEDTRTTSRVLDCLYALRIVEKEIVPEPSPFKGRDMDVS